MSFMKSCNSWKTRSNTSSVFDVALLGFGFDSRYGLFNCCYSRIISCYKRFVSCCNRFRFRYSHIISCYSRFGICYVL